MTHIEVVFFLKDIGIIVVLWHVHVSVLIDGVHCWIHCSEFDDCD